VNIAHARLACSSAGLVGRRGVSRLGRVANFTRSARCCPEPGLIREVLARLDHHDSGRVGSRGEVELELASWGWPGARRRTSTEAQVGEHPCDVVGCVGDLHQAHRTAATRACHDIDREHLLQQPRPWMCRAGGLAIPSSSVAASSDNGICIGSVGTDTGPGTTSGRALAWAASTP
jgi:hypothetical protein